MKYLMRERKQVHFLTFAWVFEWDEQKKSKVSLKHALPE